MQEVMDCPSASNSLPITYRSPSGEQRDLQNNPERERERDVMRHTQRKKTAQKRTRIDLILLTSFHASSSILYFLPLTLAQRIVLVKSIWVSLPGQKAELEESECVPGRTVKINPVNIPQRKIQTQKMVFGINAKPPN